MEESIPGRAGSTDHRGEKLVEFGNDQLCKMIETSAGGLFRRVDWK